MLFHPTYARKRRNRRIAVAIMILAAVALLGLIGRCDESSEQMELDIYCANVKDGTWPDFDNKYKTACRKPRS